MQVQVLLSAYHGPARVLTVCPVRQTRRSIMKKRIPAAALWLLLIAFFTAGCTGLNGELSERAADTAGKMNGTFSQDGRADSSGTENESGFAGALTGQPQTEAYTEPSQETVLPVISITTDGYVTDEYLPAQMSITDEAGGTAASGLYDGGISIRLRGNSTKWRKKQPYNIKLDTKADLFGMGKNSHWVLLANDIDHTLIRNKIVLDLAYDLGMKTASRSVLVSLYMNGDYRGVYQLTEQIRVGKNRIDIYDWKDTFCSGDESGRVHAVNASAVKAEQPQTGGFVLEADFYAFSKPDSEITKVITAFKQPFYFKTPELVDKDTELFKYTYNYIQSFEYALHSPDHCYHADGEHYTGSGKGYSWKTGKWNSEVTLTDYTDTAFDGCSYAELFDMDSLVTNFLVCEISMNWDSMKNSTFLYKDIDGPAYIGPAWDYDWAFGNINMFNIDTWYPEGWQTLNDYFTNEQYYQSVQWNRYLIRDPYFISCLYEKYREMRPTAIQSMIDSIDSYENYLAYDGKMNDKKWSSTYSRDYSGAKSMKYSAAFESLKKFVSIRMQWLDAQFADMDTLTRSLGAYVSSDALEAEALPDGNGGCRISVSVYDTRSISSVRIQLNGRMAGDAAVTDGKAELTVPAGLLQEVNTAVVYALDSAGEYIFPDNRPEANPKNSYIIF